MRCPLCDGKMQSGSAEISRSATGALFDLVAHGVAATSRFYLYFTADGGGDSACVDHSRRVYRCPECEALLISGTEPERGPRGRKREKETVEEPPPSNCPACGAAIHPLDRRCPGCDIALK